MDNTEIIPKVFISYSWSSDTHSDWVLSLAKRLVHDGVNVVIDVWDLKEGHNKYHFMENMVNSLDISKVLLILDKEYELKANEKHGGVGTETQIISPSIYDNVAQEKFIPIIATVDSDGRPYIPIFLSGRMYIDLSSNDHYEANYLKLIRNIHGRPELTKPKIGKAPSFIFEDSPMTYKTSAILRTFDLNMYKHPDRFNSIIRDFLEEFYINLKDFEIEFINSDSLDLGKQICDNLTAYSPLRNDYISMLQIVTKVTVQVDIDIFIKFFEKLVLLTEYQRTKVSHYIHDTDNFRFIIHELFLYTIGLGLKNENYKFVAEMLYSKYFIRERIDLKRKEQTYEKLYYLVDSIDTYYNQTFGKNFICPMADFIIKRIPDNLEKELIVEADILCLYVSQLNNFLWFPITYIYNTNQHYEIFERMTSFRHFEKVKPIFDVESILEFQQVLLKYKENDKEPDSVRYSNSRDRVLPIYKIIDITKIGTAR